ncbi:MAG: hypothetical protein KDI56_02450 [Xanthomonadales bacterium]|nr:hypothetical protein [Xanthomonadales bacterium]
MTLSADPSAPTDFDFVLGHWRVRHRRLRERLCDCQAWIEFDGEMSTRPVLGGYGNLEDNLLHHPDGDFRAVALRAFDPRSGDWRIWWLDGRFPDQLDVPVVGRFANGIGTFLAADHHQGRPITVRFLWRQISTDSLRWEQAFSTDAGQSWETNWTMDFVRRLT